MFFVAKKSETCQNNSDSEEITTLIKKNTKIKNTHLLSQIIYICLYIYTHSSDFLTFYDFLCKQLVLC
jgi:hypothetical protein